MQSISNKLYINKSTKQMNEAKSFHHKGHDYTVAPIENSEQYVATRDNRNVAYTDDINLYISTEFDEVRDQIAQLFTTKK